MIACSPRPAIKENIALESPPILDIVDTPADPALQTKVDKDVGLGEVVQLINAKQILLKQPFEQAWNTVATVLQFNKIEVTDRNREKGEYFINFDPDNVHRKEGDTLDDVAFFLFKDEYPEVPYKLILTKEPQAVKISVKKRNYVEMDLLDDGEELTFDDEVKNDGIDKLIRYLYATLKNDLPVD